MTTVWVYEHLSGGAADAGLGDTPGPDDAALRADGLAMRDAVVDDLAALPGLRCETGIAKPGETAPAMLRRAAADHDLLWVIAPETGGVLGRLARAAPAAQWLGCSASAIELAGSKLRTLQALAAHDRALATPLHFATDPRVQHWVVKPDDGAGSVDTRRHADRSAAEADLAGRRGRGAPAVLEPWVDGEAMSLSLLCSARGAELLSVNRQQVAVDAAGRVAFHGLVPGVHGPGDLRHALLARWAQRVHAALPGLRGFVGVDLVWHAERGPVLIEVNPRVTCALVGLSRRLGRSVAAGVLAQHHG